MVNDSEKNGLGSKSSAGSRITSTTKVSSIQNNTKLTEMCCKLIGLWESINLIFDDQLTD